MTKCCKTLCKVCCQPVTKKNGFECQGRCKKWVHFKCMSHPTPGRIVDMKRGVLQVYCPCPDCKPNNNKKEFYIDTTCKRTGCLARRQPPYCNTGCKDGDHQLCENVCTDSNHACDANFTGKCLPNSPCAAPVYPSPCSASPDPNDCPPTFYIRPKPDCYHTPPCNAPAYPSTCNASDSYDCPPTFYIRPKPDCCRTNTNCDEPKYPCSCNSSPEPDCSTFYVRSKPECCKTSSPEPNCPKFCIKPAYTASLTFPDYTEPQNHCSLAQKSSECVQSSSCHAGLDIDDVCTAIEELTGQVNTLLRRLQTAKAKKCQRQKGKASSFLCSCKKLLSQS